DGAKARPDGKDGRKIKNPTRHRSQFFKGDYGNDGREGRNKDVSQETTDAAGRRMRVKDAGDPASLLAPLLPLLPYVVPDVSGLRADRIHLFVKLLPEVIDVRVVAMLMAHKTCSSVNLSGSRLADILLLKEKVIAEISAQGLVDLLRQANNVPVGIR